MIVRRLVGVLLAIPVVLIVLHTIVRIVRHFHKFPMPEFMADLIDHPLRVANVYNLPFEDGTFDAVYMIAVSGEIPEPRRAMQEFHRVLSRSGTLVFNELLLDPDYPLADSLVRMAASAGFRQRKKIGGFFYYTLIFEKDL